MPVNAQNVGIWKLALPPGVREDKIDPVRGLRPCGHPPLKLRVQAIGRQPQRAPDGAPVRECHRPEQTTLHRLAQQHAAAMGRRLENFMRVETFEKNVASGVNDVQWLTVPVAAHDREIFAVQPVNGPGNRVAVPVHRDGRRPVTDRARPT